MKKKILSMVMAATMVLSVSSVSQAAATETTITPNSDGKYAAGEIVANGAYEAPTIKVSIDTAAKSVIINPYGLSKGTSSDADEKKEQLISSADSIENKSDVAVAVNATVIATPEGQTKIATAPVVPATEKANSIFAYLNVKKGQSAEAVMKMADNAYNAKAENQVAFTTKSTTKKNLAVLDDPAKSNGDKFLTYKILGTVAANPTTPWTAADKVKFSIIFDFEPRLVASTTP